MVTPVMGMTKKIWLVAGMLLGLAAAAGALLVYSGVYNVAADEPHSRTVYALLETIRERSIAAHAAKLRVPENLDNPARIRQGAGNYNAMCTGCHLAPGMASTEISRGLYPAPPDLTRAGVPAAQAFWVIKHGIKASGMPAWGKSMGDDYIWNMTAFLQVLPKLDEAQYTAMVASSGGHSHGGGESKPHGHGPNAPADHHAAMHPDTAPSPNPAAKPTQETVQHRHADGTVESHPVPAADPPSTDNHDDHHH